MSHTVRLKDLFARRSPRADSQSFVRVRPELVTLESRDVPATAIWDGGGSDNNWTNPLNWQADVAPTPGVDDLLFPTGAARTTNTNDFAAGTKFVSIQVESSYTFNGNALELTQSGGTPAFRADIAAGTVTVNLPNITFSGANPVIRAEQTGTNLVFTTSSKITIGPSAGQLIISSEATVNNRIEIRGPITGTGDLVKIDTGRLVLAPAGPSLNNSYTGTTFINEGDLQLSGTGTPVTAIPGNIVIGDNNVNTGTATLLQTTNDQIADTATVTIQGDGIYNLGAQTEQIGGLVIGSSIGGGQITGTGTLELGGDVTVTGDPNTGSKIAPDITLINPTTTFTVPESINNNSGPDLLFTGSIDGPANLNLVFTGGGRTEMQAVNTGGYTTIVNDGVLILNKNAGTGGGGVVPGNLIIGDSLGFPGSAEVRIQLSNGIADISQVSIESDGILTSSASGGSDKIAALVSTSTDAQVSLGIFTLQIAPPSDFVYNGAISGDGQIQIVAPSVGTIAGRQTFAGPISLTGLGFGQFSMSNSGGAILEVNGPVTGGGGGLSTTTKGAADKLYSSSISTRIQTFSGDSFYPGTFTTGGPATTMDLTSDGKFISRINTTSVFGSLAVTGLVNSLGELRVELPTTYRPSVGEAFKILDIIDPSVRLAFNGITFTGLPEGARFFDSTGTVEFEITYAGGDGNDVLIINTGAPSVRVRRAGDQPATTSATSAAFTALFSAPVQPIVPPGVRVTTTGTVTYESVQIQQQNDSTFRITVLGLSGLGTVAVSLDQGAAFSLAGTPSQPSLSINDENVVTVTTGGGGVSPPVVPPGGTTGGLGFFSGLPGSRTLVGSGVGGGGVVNVYQGSSTPNGQLRMTGSSFSNGVRVASADFNFDGVQDYLLGSGPGGVTSVQLLDGRTGAVLFNVQPFESAFTGGVFVSTGDVTGDGRPDIVISPDEGGGPRVLIFRGGDFVKIADFFGINDPLFQGGARTTLGDINGDGFADVVVAAGFGGGPRISVYNGKALASGLITNLFSDFFAFEPSLRNGTFVAVSDINGDGFGDLIAGAGPGGAPRVTTYDGKALTSGGPVPGLVVISNFFAGPETNRGGVPLGLSDFDGDGTVDLLTGTGVGEGSRVRVYPTSGMRLVNPPLIADFDAFPGFTGGVFVG